jgi:hypothetical protein
MLRKSFTQMKKITFVLLLLFVALVFMQGCQKLSQGKAEKIITQYMESNCSAVIKIPDRWQYTFSPYMEYSPPLMEQMAIAEALAEELRKAGAEISITRHNYLGGVAYIIYHMNKLPKDWEPYLIGRGGFISSQEGPFYLRAFKKVNIKVTRIYQDEDLQNLLGSKNVLKAEFQFEWSEPTKPAQVWSEIYSKVYHKPLTLEKTGPDGWKLYSCASPKKGNGTAPFKLYKDEWKIVDSIITRPHFDGSYKFSE